LVTISSGGSTLLEVNADPFNFLRGRKNLGRGFVSSEHEYTRQSLLRMDQQNSDLDSAGRRRSHSGFESLDTAENVTHHCRLASSSSGPRRFHYIPCFLGLEQWDKGPECKRAGLLRNFNAAAGIDPPHGTAQVFQSEPALVSRAQPFLNSFNPPAELTGDHLCDFDTSAACSSAATRTSTSSISIACFA
jgi:hypothetical protein